MEAQEVTHNSVTFEVSCQKCSLRTYIDGYWQARAVAGAHWESTGHPTDVVGARAVHVLGSYWPMRRGLNMKKGQRKSIPVVVEPLAVGRPGVCPKCADRHKAWSVNFCGPEQRLGSCDETARHTLGDPSEHLVFSCGCCGFRVATACANGVGVL